LDKLIQKNKKISKIKY